MSRAVPFHDLAMIKALSHGAAPIVGRKLAVEPVMARLDLDEDDARTEILDMVASLTLVDFVQTLTNKQLPADVYGIERHRCGWYVKVALENGLVVISCHPPMHPLRTCGGIWIR